MNERINQLYAESVMSVHEAFIARMLVPSKVDLQFAELIVEECLYIVKGEDDGSTDTKSVRLAMIRMKKHFGVEE